MPLSDLVQLITRMTTHCLDLSFKKAWDDQTFAQVIGQGGSLPNCVLQTPAEKQPVCAVYRSVLFIRFVVFPPSQVVI